MVEIRKLRPLVALQLPQKEEIPKWKRTTRYLTRNRRTRADYPPPTPQPTPCVLWQGSVDQNGYGRRKVNGSVVRMHRWIMEKDLRRKLKPDEVVLHLCDNPPCYRLSHLRLGTQQENNADRDAKGRTVTNPQHMHGETNGRAKLTRKQIEEIKAGYRGGIGVSKLSRMHNVNRSTVYRAIKGETWAADATPEDLFTKIAKKREEDERQRGVEADDD